MKISDMLITAVCVIIAVAITSISCTHSARIRSRAEFEKETVIHGYAHYEVAPDGSAHWEWNNFKK